MNRFELTSDYKPTGDQPEAIRQLTEGVLQGVPAQTLLGVTGSGKTFTIANVVANINKPTLVLSHNKTLAAQLYSEFKSFFPHNAVEYYVSYYDYYQPEAYLPSTDTYIEKDLAINDEIDKLRLAATSALLSGRQDVLVVSSVSCIYGMGNPADFYENVIEVIAGKTFSRNVFLRRLVDSLYVRNDLDLARGNFRVKGDTVDIYLAYSDNLLRVIFWGDEVDSIEEVDPVSGVSVGRFDSYKIYPANLFMTTKEGTLRAIHQIEDDLHRQVEYFEKEGKPLEAKRLYERVTYDMEMLRELGHCSGIENYSRYFDGRAPGTRPYCLLDFFPKDYLMVIDESHVSVPQIRAMYGGDHARKVNLVEYGFRLPAAMDNRPLKFDEFEKLLPSTVFVSATPGPYELTVCGNHIVEQVIRPTGLVDPKVYIHPTAGQIDHLVEKITEHKNRGERTLVLALTKKTAEDLSTFFTEKNIKTRYLHSDIEALDRVEILKEFRQGKFDVLVGINLLREGIDIPQVGLVAILGADNEGFLRNTTTLIQISGRAARNAGGEVILYADRKTDSIRYALNEMNRRRQLQEAYNKDHKAELTDEKVLEAAADNKEKLHIGKVKGGIVVKGIHDVAVRFSKCCNPIPGDEIVGYVTRGRGVTIHRTDCINVINMSEDDRHRLIDAEWQAPDNTAGERYMAELNVYAYNRTGLIVDISKIFTERKIDISALNTRTSKQGVATIDISFEVASKEELNGIIEKIRQIESVKDIERTAG